MHLCDSDVGWEWGGVHSVGPPGFGTIQRRVHLTCPLGPTILLVLALVLVYSHVWFALLVKAEQEEGKTVEERARLWKQYNLCLHPDRWLGLPPMAAATQAVLQAVMQEENKENFLKDSPEPFPVFRVGESLVEDLW